MRTKALQNIIALLILGGSLIFGFLPRSDLFPVKVDIYIQGDTLTFREIEQDFQEGVRDLKIVVDNNLSASAFFGDLLLTEGEHQLVFHYFFKGELLDSKDILFEPSRFSSIRVNVNRTRILNLEAK
ncbi:MAG: hypothetical protein NUV68_02120 [Caldiserica bacterium]|nr:hypothetical protein [Caldisericota bacterium]MDH7562154.1 hypothetical protein [Caldisericota bacterium]